MIHEFEVMVNLRLITIETPSKTFWLVPISDYFDKENYIEKYDTDYDNALQTMRENFPCRIDREYIYCPWKNLTKLNKDLIKTQLKTKVYLENLQYSIEYATGVLYDDYDDHNTEFILKHVQIEYFKTLPPLLHCSVRINTRQSKEWFREHLKDVIDEWFRGFVFDGATNEVCESISIL
jgi:hypothetical protein